MLLLVFFENQFLYLCGRTNYCGQFISHSKREVRGEGHLIAHLVIEDDHYIFERSQVLSRTTTVDELM